MQTPSKFDWKDANAARHLEKHGGSFDFAIGVFLDANRLEEPDLREPYDPPRFNTVGIVDDMHQRHIRHGWRHCDHHFRPRGEPKGAQTLWYAEP